MYDRVAGWIGLLLVAGWAAGCPCDRGESVRDAGPASEDAAAEDANPPEAIGALAVVDGVPVGVDAYLQHIASYPDRLKQSPRGREYLLRGMVDQILLEQEAKRRGLDRDPEFVRKVESYRRNLLNDMLLKSIRPEGYEVTPEEARAYYREHPEEFGRPERVEARHILVTSEEQARALLAELRRGASFEELARTHSRDAATREKGGSLGAFTRAQRPELAEVAFALEKPGELAGPFETRRGVHLLQLVRRLPAEEKTFEQMRDELLTRLRARMRQEARQELLERLRARTSITIREEVIEDLEVPAGP